MAQENRDLVRTSSSARFKLAQDKRRTYWKDTGRSQVTEKRICQPNNEKESLRSNSACRIPKTGIHLPLVCVCVSLLAITAGHDSVPSRCKLFFPFHWFLQLIAHWNHLGSFKEILTLGSHPGPSQLECLGVGARTFFEVSRGDPNVQPGLRTSVRYVGNKVASSPWISDLILAASSSGEKQIYCQLSFKHFPGNGSFGLRLGLVPIIGSVMVKCVGSR